jgi:hypothetical protein
LSVPDFVLTLVRRSCARHAAAAFPATAFLNTLAAEPLNGRKIKNIVRTAYALAMAEESNIRPQDIEISLQSIKDFEEDFARHVADAEMEIARPNTPSASGRRAKRSRQE